MEGISNEAASLAGHWGLGKLICLYDDNKISIDGDTEISFTEDVGARFEALGWHVQTVTDGNTDLGALRGAIQAAKDVTDKPSMIKVTPPPPQAQEDGCNMLFHYSCGLFPHSNGGGGDVLSGCRVSNEGQDTHSPQSFCMSTWPCQNPPLWWNSWHASPLLPPNLLPFSVI